METLEIGFLLSEDILKGLDQLAPPRPPDPNDTEREIWMKAGERRLVEKLWVKFQQAQQEGILHV